MKHRYYWVLSLFLLGMIAGCSGSTTVGGTGDEGNTANEAVETDPLAIYAKNLISAEQESLTDFKTATHYALDITLVDPYEVIEGQETITYYNNEDGQLNEIYLRMFPNNGGDLMQVSSLKVAGVETAFAVEFNNTAVRVDLSTALQPGESVDLELTYSVQVPTDFGGNYGLFSYMEGILALDQIYLIIPIYDDEGWNVEIPPTNGDMIYADAAFFTATITAPSDLVIASSGVTVDEKEDGDTTIHTIVAGPERDFYMAASTEFEVSTQMVGETLVSSYYLPEYPGGGDFVLRTAVEAVQTFNKYFGTYPYTELDLVGTPMQAGGMEYSGIVALGLQYYDPQAKFSGMSAFNLLEFGTAHEVAHEWFFNLVMSDQIDEPWIDEGMAQYLTALYFEDNDGPTAAYNYRSSWNYRWERVEYQAIPIGLPVREYDTDGYGAIIYGRAPLFIHDLREKMGDEVFFGFLKTLFMENKWDVLTTEEFRTAAEQACDCDLQWEFNNWVYQR